MSNFTVSGNFSGLMPFSSVILIHSVSYEVSGDSLFEKVILSEGNDEQYRLSINMRAPINVARMRNLIPVEEARFEVHNFPPRNKSNLFYTCSDKSKISKLISRLTFPDASFSDQSALNQTLPSGILESVNQSLGLIPKLNFPNPKDEIEKGITDDMSEQVFSAALHDLIQLAREYQSSKNTDEVMLALGRRLHDTMHMKEAFEIFGEISKRAQEPEIHDQASLYKSDIILASAPDGETPEQKNIRLKQAFTAVSQTVSSEAEVLRTRIFEEFAGLQLNSLPFSIGPGDAETYFSFVQHWSPQYCGQFW